MIPKVKLVKSVWKTAYLVRLQQFVKDVLKTKSLTQKVQNVKELALKDNFITTDLTIVKIVVSTVKLVIKVMIIVPPVTYHLQCKKTIIL